MATMRRDRSYEQISAEDQMKMEEETRERYDSIAPKRHTKPLRSEYSTQYSDSVASSDGSNIPELIKFQHLEHDDPQKLVYNGSEASEEFVETEYYQDLNCVGKQHHTTGTGFIGMDSTTNNTFKLAADTDPNCHASSKGNPATNEWIPSPADDTIISTSNKPSRSENK